MGMMCQAIVLLLCAASNELSTGLTVEGWQISQQAEDAHSTASALQKQWRPAGTYTTSWICACVAGQAHRWQSSAQDAITKQAGLWTKDRRLSTGQYQAEVLVRHVRLLE